MRTDSDPVEICLPIISDETVVEIHDFLQDFLQIFESHYGAQIHRFYEDRSFANLVHPNPLARPPDHDPPF